MIHSAITKAKFKKLKRRLGVPHYAVVGVLESIWHIGSASCHDGAIGKMTNEDIAAEIEWAGDPDTLVQSLIDCGWLDLSAEHRLVIHDWAEHCPRFVKGAMAKHGKKFAKPDPVKQPAIAPCPGQPAKAPCNSTVPPNLTKPNLTKPKLLSSLVANGPGGPCPPESAQKTPEMPALLTFPCRGNEKEWHLYQNFVDLMESAFPGLPVLAECKRALAWIGSNPERIKTATGMKRFLNAWLSKAANSQTRAQAPAPAKVLTPEAQAAFDRLEAVKKLYVKKQPDDIPIAAPILGLGWNKTPKTPVPTTEPPKPVISEIKAHSDETPKTEQEWEF